MMQFKKGVKLDGVKPETVLAIMVAQEVFFDFGNYHLDFVVTSVKDGKHMKGSKHYTGYAFDMRTRDLTKAEIQIVFDELKKRLTDEYDVVLEPTHIHVEFDPK